MRFVGTSEYGQYSLFLSQCNLIAALGFGWLNQAQLRYYSQDRLDESYKSNQFRSFLYSVIFCLINTSILFSLQTFSKKIWLISLLTIFTIGIFNYTKTVFQAKLFPKNVIYLTSLQSLFSLITPLILMYYLGYKAEILLLGIGISFLFSTLIITKKQIIELQTYFSLRKSVKGKIKNIKKWFFYGSPLSIWFAAGLALSFLDRYFINYYLQSDELGVYSSLQEILVRSFSLTLFPFTLALHPRIMTLWNKSKFREAVELILKSFYVILFVGLSIVFFIWYFNDFIFLFIRTIIPEFDIQSKLLIIPLLSAGFLWQISFLTHKMMELREQTMLMTIAIFPSLVINIIGNSLYLPKFGQIATAYTAFFSALVYCFITGIHFVYTINKIRIS